MSWIVLSALLVFSLQLALSSANCGDGVICGDKAGDDLAPTNTQDYTYRFSQLSEGTLAADVAILVSLVEGERDHVLWLQLLVPLLESRLKQLGIGLETDAPNRYCLIQYGNNSHLHTKFLKVADKEFFSSTTFGLARRQLVRAGHAADGYQAVDFALKHVPFRDQPDVAKFVFLVSNTRRSALPTHANLTLDVMKGLLLEKGMFFTSIIAANISIASSSSNTIAPVLGLTEYGKGVALGENYNFSAVEGHSIVTSNKEGIIHDYLNLTLEAGGNMWALHPLSLINVSVVESFIGATLSEFGVCPLRTEEVCERCWCDSGEEEEGEEEEGECKETCEVDPEQNVCGCLAQNSPEECVHLINPSPVSVEIRSTSTLTGPAQTPIVLEVSGSVSLGPGGDVDVDFTSNKNRATYNCVLLDNSTQTPDMIPCTSPFQMKGVDEGHHAILVIARRKGFFGTRLFDFEVEPQYGSEGGQLQVALAEQWQLQNGYLLVDIFVTGGRSRGFPQLFCSVASSDLAPCTSPYQVHQDNIDEDTGALLVVVAVEDRTSVAVATRRLEKPVDESKFPVRIIVLGVEPPDSLGRISIHFRTSRSDVDCLCRTNISHSACSSVFKADPQQLGSGTHNLSIVCMDHDGYSATKTLKVILPRPPPIVEGPLSCNLSVVGPTPQGVVLANFGCDRRVMATCQVSGRPAVSCDVFVGSHEIDVSALSSGQHLFILNVEDGYGKSLMKVHQFTIGTAHRKCCPQINTAQSTLTWTSTQPTYSILDLRVLAGNCTDSEGFSYNINWGDGTTDMGLSHRLSNVAVSKTYNSTSIPLTPAVEVSYCNSPLLQLNKCCDQATFLHN